MTLGRHNPVRTILMAALMATSLASFGAGTGTSLIPNGDFEPGQNGSAADVWKGENLSVEKEEDGNHFLRLKSPEPGKMVMVYIPVAIAPGTKALEVSYRARSEGIKVGKQSWFDGRIILNFKDAQKKIVGSPNPPTFQGTRKDWKTGSMKLLVPAGAVTLEVMPSLFQVAAGTLDLDDLRVTAMSDADAEAMIAAIAAAAKKKAEQAALVALDLALPPVTPELKVAGTQVVTADVKALWLQGLSVDSMQWGTGDNILWSMRVAVNDWHANVIRLAVHDTFWFGRGKGQAPGTEEAYRKSVDQAVQFAAAKGIYLVLDLHQFGAPMPEHVEFWKSAAARYKNNPAVLFELFNEPHGISWQVWRDGGNLKSPENKSTDVNPTENTEKQAGENSVGMQAMVDAVRATGAKNILVIGALDWAYDLTGIVNGYALDDRGGNGIMYVSHIYPWKSGWQEKVLVAAAKHPVIITEVGCPADYSGFQFIPPPQQYPLDGWAEDVIAFMQTNKLHWTGFSFHPRCGPQIILDWDYNPTPYWGVYVKAALGGKTFELKKMR